MMVEETEAKQHVAGCSSFYPSILFECEQHSFADIGRIDELSTIMHLLTASLHRGKRASPH